MYAIINFIFEFFPIIFKSLIFLSPPKVIISYKSFVAFFKTGRVDIYKSIYYYLFSGVCSMDTICNSFEIVSWYNIRCLALLRVVIMWTIFDHSSLNFFLDIILNFPTNVLILNEICKKNVINSIIILLSDIFFENKW